MTLTDYDLKKIEQVSEKVASKHTEELAVIVAKGFQGQREYMDGRFANIEETLEDHGHHLQRIDQRLQAMDGRLDTHDRRITRTEKVLNLPPIA